jgi:succinate dehydrogenase/fumarate reductase-like Fe-S protein
MRVTVVRGPAPDGGKWEQTYEVPDLGGASVSDVLQYISRHLDGSVAYYLSCRRGLCAACVVRLKGQNEKACVVHAYDGIVIEPTNDRLLIKDSVCHLGMPAESEFDLAEVEYRSNTSFSK